MTRARSRDAAACDLRFMADHPKLFRIYLLAATSKIPIRVLRQVLDAKLTAARRRGWKANAERLASVRVTLLSAARKSRRDRGLQDLVKAARSVERFAEENEKLTAPARAAR